MLLQGGGVWVLLLFFFLFFFFFLLLLLLIVCGKSSQQQKSSDYFFCTSNNKFKIELQCALIGLYWVRVVGVVDVVLVEEEKQKHCLWSKGILKTMQWIVVNKTISICAITTRSWLYTRGSCRNDEHGGGSKDNRWWWLDCLKNFLIVPMHNKSRCHSSTRYLQEVLIVLILDGDWLWMWWGKCGVIDNNLCLFCDFEKKCGLHMVIWAGNITHSRLHVVEEELCMCAMSHLPNGCSHHHSKSKSTVQLGQCGQAQHTNIKTACWSCQVTMWGSWGNDKRLSGGWGLCRGVVGVCGELCVCGCTQCNKKRRNKKQQQYTLKSAEQLRTAYCTLS